MVEYNFYQHLKLIRQNDARKFAIRAHGDQLYGREPYVNHLDDVVHILDEFEVGKRMNDIQLLKNAAYLHDVLEDTNTTYAELFAMFGEEVADIVVAVTSPVGDSRKERHELLYPITQRHLNAVTIKIADRLANVRRGAKNTMYAKEHAYFRKMLYGRTVTTDKMEVELDKILGWTGIDGNTNNK